MRLRESTRRLNSPAGKELREVMAALERRLASAHEDLRKEQDGHRVEKRRAQQLEATLADSREEIARLQMLLSVAEADVCKEKARKAEPSESALRIQEELDAVKAKLAKAQESSESFERLLHAATDVAKEEAAAAATKLEKCGAQDIHIHVFHAGQARLRLVFVITYRVLCVCTCGQMCVEK